MRGGVILSWLLWLSSSQPSEIAEANGTNFLTLRGEHIWVISSPSLPVGNKLTIKRSVINVHQCVCDICIVCSTLQTDWQVIKVIISPMSEKWEARSQHVALFRQRLPICDVYLGHEQKIQVHFCDKHTHHKHNSRLSPRYSRLVS